MRSSSIRSCAFLIILRHSSASTTLTGSSGLLATVGRGFASRVSTGAGSLPVRSARRSPALTVITSVALGLCASDIALSLATASFSPFLIVPRSTVGAPRSRLCLRDMAAATSTTWWSAVVTSMCNVHRMQHGSLSLCSLQLCSLQTVRLHSRHSGRDSSSLCCSLASTMSQLVHSSGSVCAGRHLLHSPISLA